MPKMMLKHGDTSPIYYDEYLFNQDPSLYQILDVQPAEEIAVVPKPKKAKPVTTEDDLNTAFDLDVL